MNRTIFARAATLWACLVALGLCAPAHAASGTAWAWAWPWMWPHIIVPGLGTW